MNTFRVKELNAYVRDLLESDGVLQDVWVTGEISNFKRANSGYLYFSLKDAEAQLRCAAFRRLSNGEQLRDGLQVQARGRVSLYEVRGEYQLYVEEVQLLNSAGDLYVQLEALKQRLAAEGLFDEARKRPLPPFPRRIGVVTSPTAAAFQDVQNVLKRRYPLVELVLSPTLVQGADAPPRIVRALERLYERDDLDALLLCRGGGSSEDLWCFNDERIVRTLARSPFPTVSAVGHEIDFTLVDFVADVRAPTPSAGAELLTPNGAELLTDVRYLDSALDESIAALFSRKHDALARSMRSLARLSPMRSLQDQRQRVDDLQERATRLLYGRIKQAQERVAAQRKALEAANPFNLLSRGYAIVTRTHDNAPVTSRKDAPVGTAVKIRLRGDTLAARIEEESTNERYKRTLL